MKTYLSITLEELEYQALLMNTVHPDLTSPELLIEIRTDRLNITHPQKLIKIFETLKPHRCIVTVRQSTAYPNQKKLIYCALKHHVYAIDLELHDGAAQLIYQQHPKTTTQLILSHHAPKTMTYNQLSMLRSNGESLGADIVKIVVPTNRHIDGLPLLQLLQEDTPWQKPLLAIASGSAGLWSRILTGTFPHPSPFTFAKLNQHVQGSAPGQIAWQWMRDVYRVPELQPGNKIWGLLGYPIDHSWSPIIHNAAFAALLPQNIYIPFAEAGDGSEFLQKFAPILDIAGLSVTAPHKAAAYANATSDPIATAAQAVNTLLKKKPQPTILNSWHGFNTDWAAALHCLHLANNHAPLYQTKIVIVGTGSVARTVGMAARTAGAKIMIVGRNPNKVSLLANQLQAEISDLQATYQADILVNATFMGMKTTDKSFFLKPQQLSQVKAVFDTVYSQQPTNLLQQAQQQGCRIVSGEHMFWHQALAQWRFFTNIPPPQQIMRQALHNTLSTATKFT